MTDQTVRSALLVIAVVVGGAALVWLREILTPLVLAIFLLIMIDGLARGVRRRAAFVPDEAALPLAILLIILSFVGAVWIVVDGATGFAAQFQGASARVNVLIADVAGLAGLRVTPTIDQILQELNLQQYVGNVAMWVQSIASDAFFVLIYLGFLLASRAGFQKKSDSLFVTPADRREAAEVFERIRGGVEGYLWVQTVTGLMIAVVAWALMAWIGLNNAVFWAFVIFLVCYIPVIGGAIAGVGPPIFALVQFDSYAEPLILLIGLQTLLFVVGNFVQPRMQGENQNIDPVVVLLSLAFWGAIWGVTGMFLSTPLTVMLMAILAEFRSTRWIAVLLSADGEPYARTPEQKARKAERKAPPQLTAPAAESGG
jgi:predicted PurR-regulated permease PerM